MGKIGFVELLILLIVFLAIPYGIAYAFLFKKEDDAFTKRKKFLQVTLLLVLVVGIAGYMYYKGASGR